MTRMIAPEIGALFEYGMNSFGTEPARYRVTGWLCPAEPPKLHPDDWIGKILYEGCRPIDGARMRWCLREEATHVTGSGIAGCIAPIEKIRVTGMVPWSAELLAEARESAERCGRRREVLF